MSLHWPVTLLGNPNLEATGENTATTKCSDRAYFLLFPLLVSFHLGSRISNLHAFYTLLFLI